MGLRGKTNIAVLFVLAALATMAGFSFRESRSLAEKDRWVSHTRDVIELSESLRSRLADAGAARRAYLSGAAKDLADFDAANKLVLKDFGTLRALTADNPEQQTRLNELQPI